MCTYSQYIDTHTCVCVSHLLCKICQTRPSLMEMTEDLCYINKHAANLARSLKILSTYK